MKLEWYSREQLKDMSKNELIRMYTRAVDLVNENYLDYEKVTRCANCKYFLKDVWEVVNGSPQITKHNMCCFWNNNGHSVKEDDYCSNAELRGE